VTALAVVPTTVPVGARWHAPATVPVVVPTAVLLAAPLAAPVAAR